MQYSELDAPGQAISSIMRAVVPSPNYQTTIQELTPVETQRDLTFAHLIHAFETGTTEAVQTKDQTDAIRKAETMLHETERDGHRIHSELYREKSELEKATADLQVQMAKEKIVIDIFWVFGATLLTYLLFHSFAYVHVFASLVLVGGIVFILNTSPYKLKFPAVWPFHKLYTAAHNGGA
jgi:hypothetical protein